MLLSSNLEVAIGTGLSAATSIIQSTLLLYSYASPLDYL
jgi:hypothetical protein